MRDQDPPASNALVALWMMGSVVSLSSMAISGRQLGSELTTFEIMAYRSYFGLAAVVGLAWALGRLRQIRRDRIGLHVVRNISHFSAQNLWFFAVAVAPLAQVTALEFTTPLWVVFMAALFLGETVSRRKVLATCLGFLGVLIVARPDVQNLSPGLVAAAFSAIGFAGAAICTKILTRHEGITSILFWLTLLQALFATVIILGKGEMAWPSATAWPWVIVVSVAGLTAHLCLTKALSLAPASHVMPFDFIRLPALALAGVLFYAEAISLWVFLGAALILAANWLNLRAASVPKR